MTGLKRLWNYFCALAFAMLDVVVLVGTDYDKLNGENILGFAFVAANCAVWTFYFMRKFCIEFSKEVEE